MFCNLTVVPLEQLRKSIQKTFSKTGVKKAATWESHGEAGLGGTPRALQLVLACLGAGVGGGGGGCTHSPERASGTMCLLNL